MQIWLKRRRDPELLGYLAADHRATPDMRLDREHARAWQISDAYSMLVRG
jgi:hypothetical protein